MTVFFSRGWTRLLVMTLSIVIALACAEVMFRWHTRHEFAARISGQTGNLVVVSGPQMFAFKPHASGVLPGSSDTTHTFAYRTNAHGLRDRDRAAKQPGARRVLVLGDSYTWGYAVSEEEAYPQAAERRLKERLPTEAQGAKVGHRPGIEIINGGVPDYNSRQERQLLAQLMPIYQPDAVFLGYVVNDAEPPTSVPVSPEETYRHAYSWFLSDFADHFNRHVLRRRLLPSTRDTGDNRYLDGFQEESMKWRDSREAIREMRDLATKAGIPFTILILPDVTQNLDGRYAWRPIHDAVTRWGRELNIPTFDLLDEFRGQDHLALMVPWDGHPNAAAHEEIAEFLVSRILELWPD